MIPSEWLGGGDGGEEGLRAHYRNKRSGDCETEEYINNLIAVVIES
jgi:hypothetical protein